MNTEELKKLGLTDEQEKSVFALHGKVVNSLKQQVTELTTERDDFKTQLEGRDKDLKGLQKQVKDNEDLSKQFKTLQEKYDTETKALSDKVATVTFDNKISEALSKTNARDKADLAKFLDREKIKLNEDGTLTGLDEQVTALQKDKAYLFNEGTRTHYSPSGGNPVGFSSDLSVAMKQDGFNMTKWLEQQKEND